jgi:transcriptional regulator of acetoin/glycerol metabolism
VSEEKSARELVDEIRSHLSEAGDRRARAASEEREFMTEIAYWTVQGNGILSVTEMARLSGVSRDTIYQILKQDQTN